MAGLARLTSALHALVAALVVDLALAVEVEALVGTVLLAETEEMRAVTELAGTVRLRLAVAVVGEEVADMKRTSTAQALGCFTVGAEEAGLGCLALAVMGMVA